VRLAETWQDSSTFGSLVTSSWQWDSAPQAVPDARTRGHSAKPGVLESTITVTDPTDIQHVGVSLDLSHTFIGDLVITLASPDGTVSTLVDRPGQTLFNPWGSSQDDIVFDLYTTQDWGETGVGDWTLTIYDYATGDAGTLNDWSLNFYGDAASADDVYIYTDEYGALAGGGTSTASIGGAVTTDVSTGGTLETASLDAEDLDAYARGGSKGPPPKDGGGGTSGEPGRSTLEDHDGGIDTINLSPVTTDTVLDLHDGATSTVAGAPLTIAAGTIIENAFLGDGNDVVLGNEVANEIDGGRGNDWLQGNEGADQVTGGDGADTFALKAGDGGLTADDADVILDFHEGEDVIGALNGINLVFTAGDATGDGVSDTVISDADTGEFLAVVSGVATVGADDVAAVTPIV
jgi:subtilisin-like proprotein convertase family protein